MCFFFLSLCFYLCIEYMYVYIKRQIIQTNKRKKIIKPPRVISKRKSFAGTLSSRAQTRNTQTEIIHSIHLSCVVTWLLQGYQEEQQMKKKYYKNSDKPELLNFIFFFFKLWDGRHGGGIKGGKENKTIEKLFLIIF